MAAAVAVAGSLALGTVTTASAAGVAPPTPAGAAAEAASRGGGGGVTPNGKLPAEIQVDEKTHKIAATLRGVGKQVYDCTNGAYVFREPIATLEELRGKKTVGIHGAGPFWASFDGSKVIGTAPVAVDPPKGAPPGVKWLKLSVSSTAGQGGVFSKVAFIQRIDTRDGLAPAKCGAPTIAVDYTTNYVFWVPK
jgi:hypothetical protein